MLYTGSGSPIPNDKPMEQFKASDEDWRQIGVRAKNYSSAEVSRAVLELRDRVAALEAKQAPGESPATAPAAPVVAVPSDEELWELQLEAKKRVRPLTPWVLWRPRWDGHEALVAAHRALYDRGAGDGYEQGLAAGRAEQQAAPEESSAAQSDPEPEPSPSPAPGLVEVVLDAMGEGTEVEARAAILAVARWLRSEGHSYYVAAELEREANR
jgi:hypothetical protein